MKTVAGPAHATATVRREPFGRTPEGRAVEIFTLAAGAATEIRIASYGGIVTSVRVPDREGDVDDIVLGHDALDGYLTRSPYFGALIGRYGNRIARGRFSLDGAELQLALNEGPHHLHGGPRGLDKVVWVADPFVRDDQAGIVLTCVSPDGDQGYPGTLWARVTYTLSGNRLTLDYVATCDRPTPVNLTHHTYWNLAGSSASPIVDHELTVFADSFTPTDALLIPTGEIVSVAGTPFDFRTPRRIGARIDEDHEQLSHGKGYDHNFVLHTSSRSGLQHAVHLSEPVTGRTLDVHTTEPGLQFYSGNLLDGSVRGKSNRVYGHRSGLCLETQHFPDSPNHPHFPSTVLRPGQNYRSRTVYTFGVRGISTTEA